MGPFNDPALFIASGRDTLQGRDVRPLRSDQDTPWTIQSTNTLELCLHLIEELHQLQRGWGWRSRQRVGSGVAERSVPEGGTALLRPGSLSQ